MTIALISDIHGNLAALEAVLAAIDAEGVRRVACLGDVGGYHPTINEVADLLRARAIPCLMGNHDWYLATGAPCPRSDAANRCLDHQRAVMRPDVRAWLAALPERLEIDGLSLVHGGWLDPLDEYLAPSEAYFAALPGEAFASGHTHVAAVWRGAGKSHCNPGAVGQPRDGDPRAAYALWDGARFALRRVAYDIADTERRMAEAGFPPYFYENLRRGARIGGRIDVPPPGAQAGAGSAVETKP
jgi:predicted phosphodiesterase